MSDYANLLAQLASMRERTESQQRLAGEYFAPTSQFTVRIALLVTQFASLEADLKDRKTNHPQTHLTEQEINELALIVSEKLRNIVMFDSGLPRVVSAAHRGSVSLR